MEEPDTLPEDLTTQDFDTAYKVIETIRDVWVDAEGERITLNNAHAILQVAEEFKESYFKD